jgi:hypothetical protein
VPDDLKDALARLPAAEAHWKSLNKSDRYATLFKIETGTKTGRSKRIQNIVQVLATGRRPDSSAGSSGAARKATKRVQRASANVGPNVQRTPPLRAGLRQRKT